MAKASAERDAAPFRNEWGSVKAVVAGQILHEDDLLPLTQGPLLQPKNQEYHISISSGPGPA